MSYHKLKEGEYKDEEIEDDKIWQIFMNIFNKGISKKTASYKFGLIHSILECIKHNPGKNRFTFMEIFAPFTEIYWGLIVEAKLYQVSSGIISSIYKIITKFIFENPQYRGAEYEIIEDDLKHNLIEKVSGKCSRNVFGALFGDSDEYFYSFSKDKQTISINPRFRIFLVKYLSIIERVNKYQWLKFLSERNPKRIIDINLLENSKKYEHIYNFELFWRDICSKIEPGMIIYTLGRDKPNEITKIGDEGLMVKTEAEPKLISIKMIKKAWLNLVNDGVLFRDEHKKASYRSSFISALFSTLDYIEENLKGKISIRLMI